MNRTAGGISGETETRRRKKKACCAARTVLEATSNKKSSAPLGTHTTQQTADTPAQPLIVACSFLHRSFDVVNFKDNVVSSHIISSVKPLFEASRRKDGKRESTKTQNCQGRSEIGQGRRSLQSSNRGSNNDILLS